MAWSNNPLKSVRLAALAVVGGGVLVLATSTLFLASVDHCLVGRWQVARSGSFPKAGFLELRGDGTAELAEFQGAPYGAVWKSRGDTLEVTLISRQRPDDDDAPADPGIAWRLRWKILEQGPETLRLQGPINSSWPSGEVMLVR